MSVNLGILFLSNLNIFQLNSLKILNFALYNYNHIETSHKNILRGLSFNTFNLGIVGTLAMLVLLYFSPHTNKSLTFQSLQFRRCIEFLPLYVSPRDLLGAIMEKDALQHVAICLMEFT